MRDVLRSHEIRTHEHETVPFARRLNDVTGVRPS
jgi:hypothetical protein